MKHHITNLHCLERQEQLEAQEAEENQLLSSYLKGFEDAYSGEEYDDNFYDDFEDGRG